MLDRGAETPTDPPIVGTSSVPNIEMPDSKPVPPISTTMAKSSVPIMETNPLVALPTTEFTFNPINFIRVAKHFKWCEAQLKLFAN